MVKKNGISPEITTWLIRAAVAVACFLANEQLSEIKDFIVQVRAESKVTIAEIATLQEKVSNIEKGILQRSLSRP